MAMQRTDTVGADDNGKSTRAEHIRSQTQRVINTVDGWFIRLGMLLPAGGNSRYGARASIAVDTLCTGRANLSEYSLIIPLFTRRRDIPSGEEKQRRLTWLWNVYEHPRYFGVLDLDMDLEAIVKGQSLLFNDAPTERYKSKADVKKAFVRRLMDGSTFRQTLARCPAFADLYDAVTALVAAIEVEKVAYFSGGGGFRILFLSPHAWRTVTWGQAYSSVFQREELPRLLRLVAPTLDEHRLARILAATDKNVYDCDKGTKPDLLAHFDTQVYPRQLGASFECSCPSREVADEPLEQAIHVFWRQVFHSIPLNAPRMTAANAKAAVLHSPQALHQFVKSPISAATHFVLQGEFTSYRHVKDPEHLYRLMVEQRRRGIPLNVHEIRTPITRHALDYDGGPPLMEPLCRVGGQAETPLHAIQEVFIVLLHCLHSSSQVRALSNTFRRVLFSFFSTEIIERAILTLV